MLERQNAGGFRFYARQFYDGDGRKREQYVSGPVGDPDADATAAALRIRIDEVRSAASNLRLLGREGYALVDPKTYATLASLHNHGVFRAGAVLIGSHAFGVLLNQLGVRSAAYATEDVDIARREGLAFAEAPAGDFLTMLRESARCQTPAAPRLRCGAWVAARRKVSREGACEPIVAGSTNGCARMPPCRH